MKRKADALLFISKEFCLEVNAKETKYVLISLEMNTENYHSDRRGNKSFESMENFKYL